MSTQSNTLSDFGAVGDGVTDDTSKVNQALASGVPLTGEGKVYAVTGTMVLPAGTQLSDTTFKQLAPGASLNVVTLRSTNVNNLVLKRVKVNRNGDGTNGGLLNASGTNGALNTAFGMYLSGGTGHLFEDLEAWGHDSGTGIYFENIGKSSKVYRPYVHDILWSRNAATDDQVQGILIQNCNYTEFVQPRVEGLTGILNGVASKRFTRGIPVGQSPGIKLIDPYVGQCDQGIDITGQNNKDLRIVRPVVRSIWTWGVKLSNAAKRCQVINGLAVDCGAGYVASGNKSLPLGTTTDRSDFIDCVSLNAGSLGQNVVPVSGFRVISIDGTNEQGSATRIRFIRCRAVDDQVTPTMTYGFVSEITEPTLSPTMIDCESTGHVLAPTQGIFLRPQSYGTVGVGQASGLQIGDTMQSGSNADGSFIKYADGTMECWIEIDETTSAWSTPEGSMFIRSAPLGWTFPQTFKTGTAPVVSATAGRLGVGSACGCSTRTVNNAGWAGHPFSAINLPAAQSKRVQLRASGRWS